MAVWGVLLGRAAGAVASGVAGVAVIEGVKRIGSGRSVHDAAVTVTALGLRGVRAAEAGAERVRLGTADVVSEARERNGEQAPAPDTASGTEHEH